MPVRLQPNVFHQSAFRDVLIDLRSREAFLKGSLPGSISFPAGDYVSVKELLKTIAEKWPARIVHVFDRHGELSEFMSVDGAAIHYLNGGYSAYTAWQNAIFMNDPPIIILGGNAGSGKTELLQELADRNEQVLDLEDLANHKGSVFGNLSDKPQETNAVFRHRIFNAWINYSAQQPVWIEEEGSFLGQNTIPETLYQRMLDAPMINLQRDFATRLAHIIREYGDPPSPDFVGAIRKLEQRMGMSANQKAIHLYNKGDITACFKLLLRYYDSAYSERRLRYRRGPQHDLNVNEEIGSLADALINRRKVL